MEVLAQPGETAPAVAGEWDTDPHPWRRYGARMIDVQLFGGVALFLGAGLIGLFGPGAWVQWILDDARWKSLLIYGPLTWIIAALAVAGALAWKGTTPGKFLFGLRLVPGDGQPLNFVRALKREALLFVWGAGFSVPLLALIAMLTSFQRVEDGKQTRWDERTDLIVEARPVAGLQLVGVVAGTVLVIVTLAWSLIARLAG